MQIKKLLLYVVSFILFILLPGCFEQNLSINSDLSGRLYYKIIYYKDFDTFMNYLYEKNIEINTFLFFNKNDLRQMIAEDQNNEILNYNIIEKNNFRACETVIRFTDITTLSKSLPINKFPTVIYEKNNLVYSSTIITCKFLSNNTDLKKLYSKLDKEEKEVIDNYISLINFKFIYTTQNPILSFKRGKISEDKKTLTYETSLYEMLNSNEDIEISLNFNKK